MCQYNKSRLAMLKYIPEVGDLIISNCSRLTNKSVDIEYDLIVSVTEESINILWCRTSDPGWKERNDYIISYKLWINTAVKVITIC